MSPSLLQSLRLTGFLSFGPNSAPVDLAGLNVLIGPNGVGKTNFIEAIELLHATPTDFRDAIRIGGLPRDWIWHGEQRATAARIEAILSAAKGIPELRYGIEFTESGNRLEIVDELLEEATKSDPSAADVRFYYRFQKGRPAINTFEIVSDEETQRTYKQRKLSRESIDPEQSILSQKKDRDLYPEVTDVGRQFHGITIYREWDFGRSSGFRLPQAANLPTDVLLPRMANLGLVLNDLEHRSEWGRFTELMGRFLPRFKRITTKVAGGSVQVYLHEEGLGSPVPATRLSDGTLRFLALLAILIDPARAPLVCIEEPELGLHPDAIALLAELLVEASQKTQVVVTTHSDTLVSELTKEADCVLVCDYGPDGTELKRLETDKLGFWLEKYQLGEVWRMGKLGI